MAETSRCQASKPISNLKLARCVADCSAADHSRLSWQKLAQLIEPASQQVKILLYLLVMWRGGSMSDIQQLTASNILLALSNLT